MTARKTKADKEAAAAAAAEHDASVEQIAPPDEQGADMVTAPPPGPDAIPVHRDGELVPDQAVSSQPIDLEGQRRMLDNLDELLRPYLGHDVLYGVAEDGDGAGDGAELEPAVYLIHPVKGHVVHITVTQAIADGALGWADATLDDIRRAGLTR